MTLFLSVNSRSLGYIKNEHCRLIIAETAPEMLGNIYWIGANWTTRTFMNNVAWLFPSRLKNILRVIGTNYRESIFKMLNAKAISAIVQGEQWIANILKDPQCANTMSIFELSEEDHERQNNFILMDDHVTGMRCIIF